MKSLLIILMVAAFVAVPVMAFAGPDPQGANPPLAQPLVREGTLAVRLVEALQIGAAEDEIEAESLLVSAGIAPHNGWIADYPVTPDIASELRDAVNDAAGAGSLSMERDAALEAYDAVMDDYGLALKPDTSGGSYEESAASPDSAEVSDYYYAEGPPVVTYYAPPPAYAYLYSWVPYPFWWWDFWFPGFYVLVDFNRVVVVGGHVHVVSNHFFDHKSHAFHRVSAPHRFHKKDGAIGGRNLVVGPATMRPGADTVLRPRRAGRIATGDGAVNTHRRGREAMRSQQRNDTVTSSPGASVRRPSYGSSKQVQRDNRLTTSAAPYGGERTIAVPRTYRARSAAEGRGERTFRSPSGGGARIQERRGSSGVFGSSVAGGFSDRTYGNRGDGGRFGGTFGGRVGR